MLDRLHRATCVRYCALEVAEVERAIRRLEAYKLRLVAPPTRPAPPWTPGSPGPRPGSPRPPPSPAPHAAREVALAKELQSGHDATAAALDDGLVSPAHAAVIVKAGRDLPTTVSDAQRQVVEAVTGRTGQALRPRPAPPGRQTRARSRRTRPGRVDAHENELVRTEEASSPGQDPVDLPRQRRRHHHRPLHHPRAGCGDPAEGHRLDDRTPAHARTPARRLRLGAPPRTRLRRAPRTPPHRPPAPQDRRHRCGHHRPHRLSKER